MGFGRGKGFSPPIVKPFPEGYTGPTELDITGYNWASWLTRSINGETYIQCHDANNAEAVPASSARAIRQWKYNTNYYYIDRYPLYFDTLAIPANAVIASAFIHAYGFAPAGEEDDIYLFNAPYLNDPPVVADYGYIRDLTTGELAVLVVADAAASRRRFFHLNQAGLDAINKGGVTKLAMRTYEDVQKIEATATAKGYWPTNDPCHLIVTYWIPP